MPDTATRSRMAHFSARLPEGLIDDLAKLAHAGDRSVGAEVRRGLREHVERERKRKGWRR